MSEPVNNRTLTMDDLRKTAEGFKKVSDECAAMRFAILDSNGSNVLGGDVSASNFYMVYGTPEKPLVSLAVGESTPARFSDGYTWANYTIKRTV